VSVGIGRRQREGPRPICAVHCAAGSERRSYHHCKAFVRGVRRGASLGLNADDGLPSGAAATDCTAAGCSG
jgi:hypothetical protein